MYTLIVLRLVHIVSGMLWVGMMAFSVVFLTPAVRDAGLAGASVMGALQRRGVMIAMPVLAVATLLSGMWLFHRLSGGAPMALLRTPVGLAFATGGVAALIAFVLGVAVMRPAMSRASTLTESLRSADTEADRAARSAEIQRLRARGAAVSRLIVVFLLTAAAAMAVARYV